MSSISTHVPLCSTDHCRERGTTMLEVLISVVILSIGLLGVAGLQGVSKRTNHQAHQRSIATHLVDGIIERIRANPTAAASYHTGTTNFLGSKVSAASEPSPNCSTGACTKAQLAAHDLWGWEQEIDGAAITYGNDDTKAGGLLNPKGCIIFTVSTGKTNTGLLSVIVNWEGMTDISDAVATGGTVCGDVAANSDRSRRQHTVNTFVYDTTE
ncbi:MAG: type IV pilus modification protein PilV [Sedimenticola sp.]